MVCVVYDHTGAEIQRIANSKEVNKYAAYVYTGILFSVSLYALAGMGVLCLAYRIALFVARIWHPGYEPVRSLTWIGWVAFAGAGLLAAVTGWFLRAQWNAAQRVRKIGSSFTREEMTRFEEINTLHGTADPTERERLLQLTIEFQQRVREAVKK